MDTTISAIPTVTNEMKTVGKKTLDKNDFMKLFITQLQYQDPMEPMDSYQMGSQLAQFSTMEATMQMSENMEELLAYQTSQNNLQLLTLLGNEAKASGNMLAVSDGSVTATEFTLAEMADSCVVEICDESGSIVRTLDLKAVPAGPYELAWDGNDSREEQVPDGPYRYSVRAYSGLGQLIEVDQTTTGRVTGVEFSSGQAMLTLDNYITIDVGDVLSVGDI
ncbi:MAG: flagellar hook assembly protein FlgD [Desulfobulbaceae bacterium]|nr:flagellar hook assembly protein FlgD [Desulfobulbaceae bacterium]